MASSEQQTIASVVRWVPRRYEGQSTRHGRPAPTPRSALSCINDTTAVCTFPFPVPPHFHLSSQSAPVCTAIKSPLKVVLAVWPQSAGGWPICCAHFSEATNRKSPAVGLNTGCLFVTGTASTSVQNNRLKIAGSMAYKAHARTITAVLFITAVHSVQNCVYRRWSKTDIAPLRI